ncbi:MAG: hypothetical protein K0S04_2546 [Herbinix sp.]|nr:hypothetical protein [Herbinix sp.]
MFISSNYGNIRELVSNCPGILAQLGEHLPYKQRVIGSSPIGPICAGVAELIERLATDQKAGGSNPLAHSINALDTNTYLMHFLCIFLLSAIMYLRINGVVIQ